jgi:NADH:quinone reductase (non-electrogenic)
MTQWLWSYATFERGARLITGKHATLETKHLGCRDDNNAHPPEEHNEA